jgi:hypothetical protein
MHLKKSRASGQGKYTVLFGSVVYRHRFDPDPGPGADPNFYVDADPDPDWHQHDANPQANPSYPQVSHMLLSPIFFC